LLLGIVRCTFIGVFSMVHLISPSLNQGADEFPFADALATHRAMDEQEKRCTLR
jgi:hypothetical protein